MFDEDYTNNFTIDEICPICDELIQWVQDITFHLGFVVVIIRSYNANGQPRRKT